VKPYAFQLEIAAAVLRGEDVIVDVGTGSGKTLCVLPEQPFELMVEQHAKFASGGAKHLYKSYRPVFVIAFTFGASARTRKRVRWPRINIIINFH
jgi:hypothetical protein